MTAMIAAAPAIPPVRRGGPNNSFQLNTSSWLYDLILLICSPSRERSCLVSRCVDRKTHNSLLLSSLFHGSFFHLLNQNKLIFTEANVPLADAVAAVCEAFSMLLKIRANLMKNVVCGVCILTRKFSSAGFVWKFALAQINGLPSHKGEVLSGRIWKQSNDHDDNNNGNLLVLLKNPLFTLHSPKPSQRACHDEG